MNQLPTIMSYGEYSTSNYGAHCLLVSIGELDLYFSYQTVVAFTSHETGRIVVSENNPEFWPGRPSGSVTGRHINWIDGGGGAKAKRLPRPEFEKRLHETLVHYGLAEGEKEKVDV